MGDTTRNRQARRGISFLRRSNFDGGAQHRSIEWETISKRALAVAPNLIAANEALIAGVLRRSP